VNYYPDRNLRLTFAAGNGRMSPGAFAHHSDFNLQVSTMITQQLQQDCMYMSHGTAPVAVLRLWESGVV
jgi:hypothetical protein